MKRSEVTNHHHHHRHNDKENKAALSDSCSAFIRNLTPGKCSEMLFLGLLISRSSRSLDVYFSILSLGKIMYSCQDTEWTSLLHHYNRGPNNLKTMMLIEKCLLGLGSSIPAPGGQDYRIYLHSFCHLFVRRKPYIFV